MAAYGNYILQNIATLLENNKFQHAAPMETVVSCVDQKMYNNTCVLLQYTWDKRVTNEGNRPNLNGKCISIGLTYKQSSSKIFDPALTDTDF